MRTKFDKRDLTRWNWMCQHRKGFKLGRNVDIGAFTYINARYGVEIGNDVQIGSHCSVYSHSTIDDKKGKVTIKQGARIGSHSIIMPSVTIGKNSVVGAFSLIKCDIPPDEMWAGVPAKFMKFIKRADK